MWQKWRGNIKERCRRWERVSCEELASDPVTSNLDRLSAALTEKQGAIAKTRVPSLSQMLHLFFYGLPLLGAFVYGLLKPGCTWMPDWTVFFAGAVIQVRTGRDWTHAAPDHGSILFWFLCPLPVSVGPHRGRLAPSHSCSVSYSQRRVLACAGS